MKFISTDFTPFTTLVSPAQSGFQYNITTGLVHPLRLWILGYPVLATNGTLGGNVLLQPWYAPGVITGSFTQTNVLVNNIPYFRQNFQVTEDKWEQLKEQFNPDSGSMIRFVDWLQYKRYLCFDLTRLADRLQSPTEPVQLAFLGTRDDNLPNGIGAVAPNLQIYALTERLNQVVSYTNAHTAIARSHVPRSPRSSTSAAPCRGTAEIGCSDHDTLPGRNVRNPVRCPSLP